ncbi:MAG: TetR/AcrR family transcriptional regulator [Lachnospiraceae bacterium]|nr:TetR/AcrR family transcriptional regulator [Lachnospiraceae bacterium]MDE7334643.1 TetR/AcrR family transcriptional regulator [Lachnospiraceae bacterium]
MESRELAPKVKATYQAVIDLFREGADLNNLTVSEITAKAGIGKGTAYEYFSNKEEMIAGALFHELKRECQDMCRQLKEEEGLYARMNRVLISMEKKMVEISCFVRVIHVLMDNSAISSKLREIVETKKEEDMLVMDIVRLILEQETGTESSLTKEERAYLTMAVFSKLVCFALYQFDPENKIGVDSMTMREMLCRDVCRDVEYYRQRGKEI